MTDQPNPEENGEVFDPNTWFMRKAIRLAAKAAEADEVPCGAVITHNGKLIAQAYNQTELLKDPTAHAEMIAITQAASAIGDWRLTDTVMYVTKEPCPMCAGAIVLARIPNVVWGMSDPKRGGAISQFKILQSDQLNHKVECVTGILELECKAQMQEFFQRRRKENQQKQAVEELKPNEPPEGELNGPN